MRRIVAGVFAALAFAAPAAAQDSGDAVRDRFAAILEAAPDKYPVKAVLGGVAIDGGAPWLAARGESMTGVPATPDMHFRNGSVAIAYLGTLLLQLAEQGTVALDDPLSKWFPEHPKADAVTLDMLIHGTSGYGDHVTDDGFLQAYYDNPFRHWEPEELIAIGLGRPMVCDPETCWSYSHTNFVILGEVLAKASGKTVEVLMRENILGPLGLEGTRSDQTAVIPEPVLHAFDSERGRYEEFDLLGPVLDPRQGRGDDLDDRGPSDQRPGYRRGNVGLAEVARAPACPDNGEVSAVERDNLVRRGGFRHQRLDRAEPIIRRLCGDDGVFAGAQARDRRIGDNDGGRQSGRQLFVRDPDRDRRSPGPGGTVPELQVTLRIASPALVRNWS